MIIGESKNTQSNTGKIPEEIWEKLAQIKRQKHRNDIGTLAKKMKRERSVVSMAVNGDRERTTLYTATRVIRAWHKMYPELNNDTPAQNNIADRDTTLNKAS